MKTRIALDAGQLQFGDFAESIFTSTNRLLNDPEYSSFLDDMKNELAPIYNDGLDFIFCEVFGLSFRKDCVLYYSGKGKPLRECKWGRQYLEEVDRRMVRLVREGKRKKSEGVDNAGILDVWRVRSKTRVEYGIRPIP